MTVKVLVLEDNPVARSFLCRVVRESFSDTMAITEAGDLDTARAQLHVADGRAEPPDADPFELILVDLELPDGSGLDLLDELAPYPAIKVVTTLYADDDHLFPALQHGADGYLLKEDRFEVLVEELQKIVRGQPPLSPGIARRLIGHFRETGQASRPSGLAADSAFSVPIDMAGSSRPVGPDRPPEDARLTPRESEVLTYLSKGFTIKEIASLVGIKWFAVNDHIKSIYNKLNAPRCADASARPSGAESD